MSQPTPPTAADAPGGRVPDAAHGPEHGPHDAAALALREERARLALAIAAGGIGIWDSDLRTGTVACSPEARAIFGLPPGREPTRDDIHALIHPDDLAIVVAASERAADPALRGREHYEYRIVRPDGATRWIAAEGQAVFEDGSDGPVAVRQLGTIQDVTERRAVVAAEAEAARRLRLALAAGRMAVWDLDLGAGRFSPSPELAALLGPFDGDAPTLDAMRARCAPGEAARVEAEVRRALAAGEPVPEVEFRFLHPTLGPRVLRLRHEVVLGDAGRHPRAIGVLSDETERRHAEAALRRETRALQVVNETGAAVAAERDLERIVQTVTDAGRELVGGEFGAFFYNVPTDTGERFMLYTLSGARREDFAGFPMPRPTAVFGPTFRGEGVVRSDDILADPRHGGVMPPGHLPVRSYLAVPVTSRAGEVLGGLLYGHAEPGRFGAEQERLLGGIAGHAATAIDNARLFGANERELKERRRAEAELQALNATLEARIAEAVAERTQAEEQLRQAQKMEAVGQLTGGIAHDFNNLLAGIVGSLELVRARVAQGRAAEVGRYVDAAMLSAQRAAALTHRLLAFSRRQPLDPKPVDANRLLAGIDDLLRRTLGPAVSVEIVRAGALWGTLCDPVQLESAILNLCINARDAMPDGGRLVVETANAHLDDAYAARHRDVRPGQYVAVSVTDTGSGMGPDVLARAFEPFFTTKPIGQGTGLGLSMVYGFAKQSEGHARVYSELGQGTTVRLYLPRHHGAAEDAGIDAQRPEPPRADAGGTVLVVEDEPVVRGLVVEVLEGLGYAAVEAADGPEGLRHLRSGRRFDLLVTDVGLPGLNGRQLAEEARALRPGLRVLFITGYAENAAVAQGFLGPGMAMLTKPFALDALARKVGALVAAPPG